MKRIVEIEKCDRKCAWYHWDLTHEVFSHGCSHPYGPGNFPCAMEGGFPTKCPLKKVEENETNI